VVDIFDLKNFSFKYCLVDPGQLAKYPGFQNIPDLEPEVIIPIQDELYKVCTPSSPLFPFSLSFPLGILPFRLPPRSLYSIRIPLVRTPAQGLHLLGCSFPQVPILLLLPHPSSFSTSFLLFPSSFSLVPHGKIKSIHS
jgi:hypothetical protein